MELRFIERDGKRILQQLVKRNAFDGRGTRFEYVDVPFVDDRIQVGPGGVTSPAQFEAESVALTPIIERLETLVAREWDKLEAERDTLRGLLNAAEDQCERLKEKRKAQESVAADWREECERLKEKLKTVEGVADYWRKECRALRDAVRAQGAHTAGQVFNDAIKIRSGV